MATIKQIKDSEGNVHDILSTIGYGTCATAAATAAKVATISDTSWTLKVGSIIGIKYTYSNTAGSSTTPVTLNVNSTGAKNIWYNNAKYTSTSSNICGYAKRVIYYMYDGTYWVWMNSGALDLPTIGNGKITIKQAGTEKGSFTVNQSGDTTIELTDNNSHYTSKNIIGSSSTATANAAVTSNGVYLNHLEESTVKSSHKISGSGTVSVTSDSNGNITITGSNHQSPGNGKITIKQAGTEKGSFTLNQSGNATIELTDNNTTYSTVTSSATGLCPKLPNDTTKFLRGDGTWVAPPDTKVTSAANHYAPSAETGSELTATLSGTAGEYVQDTEYTVLTGVKVQRDSKGHVTGITYSAQKIKDESLLLEITYDDLKYLRDSGALIPGKQYRIMDYVTKTTQENTQSAEHQFDIIVTALDNSTLCEEAHAIKNQDDEYFDGYGCNLDAWKIWYCLDNDTSRFGWTDGYEGKGIIYRMIDEWGNDCPYDFKNIMFKRELYYDGAGIASIEGDGDFETYCYTFSWEDSEDEIMDASIVGNNGDFTCVCENTIGHLRNFKDFIVANGDDDVQMLNDIVFFGTYGLENAGGEFYGFRFNTFGNDCYTNTFGDDCHKNTFGHNCSNNTFGNYCYSNTFGNECSDNTFGDDCYENTFGNFCQCNTFDHGCYCNNFGNSCQSNAIGYGCYLNTFGYGFYDNILGEECFQNTFGNYCSKNELESSCVYNIFGDECNSNKLGESCQSNFFGNYCYYNKFGVDCHYNHFGNKCYHNKFGNECADNTFGNGCYLNIFTLSEGKDGIINNVSNNHFADSCSNINLYYPDSNGVIKNYNINKGVSGKNILVEFENSEICVDVWVASSGEVIQEYINDRITTTDIDLIWDRHFASGLYSTSATSLVDETINSIGIGDYDE